MVYARAGCTSLPKKPHLDPKSEGQEGDRKSVGGNLPAPQTLRRRGTMGDIVPDDFKSLSSSSLLQVGILPIFLDWQISITSNWLVLNIVLGQHL